jgi:hypothetical protein
MQGPEGEGRASTHHGRRRRQRESAGDGAVGAAVREEEAELEHHWTRVRQGGRSGGEEHAEWLGFWEGFD